MKYIVINVGICVSQGVQQPFRRIRGGHSVRVSRQQGHSHRSKRARLVAQGQSQYFNWALESAYCGQVPGPDSGQRH